MNRRQVAAFHTQNSDTFSGEANPTLVTTSHKISHPFGASICSYDWVVFRGTDWIWL